MAIQKTPSPVRSPSAASTPLIDLRGIKVLVVDDDHDTRSSLSCLLRSAHADVEVAESAFEALRMLRASRPDVILSDINMPDGDGYQLMRMVRSRTPEEGGCTPGIALTGHSDPLAHTRALLAGFQIHLAKPVAALELLVTIRSVAARSRA